MNYNYFMKMAYDEAKRAYKLDEVPIGCVVVLDDKIIGRGYNKRMTEKNVLAHAEIIAINQACNSVNDWRLEDATLFVTVEPCPMCAGAIVQSRIKRVVFAARNPKAGCAGSIFNLLQEDKFNHKTEIVEGVMQEECAQLMKEFFKEFRKKREKPKGVIFDFDGTMADSGYVWEKVDINFFSKRNMQVPEDYLDVISSLSFNEGAIYTKEKYNIKESLDEIMKEWHDNAIDEYRYNVKLKSGVKEYITKLKMDGVKIGLATASNPEFYVPVLERYEILSLFDCVIDGKSGIKGKDTPDMYLSCAKGLGISADECIVYEDIYKGIKSAKSVGMKAVGVYEEKYFSDKEKILEIADGYIYGFDELL